MLFSELKALLIKASLLEEEQLVKNLSERAGSPLKLLLLTGVFTSEENSSTDLVLVGKLKPLVITRLIHNFERDSGKEIRYTLMTDKEFRDMAKIWNKKLKNHRVIFITHGPPYKTKLDKLHGSHVGNKDYLYFVKEFQPALYISGHLHENAGKIDKLGRTICVNPGWEGKVLEIK